MPVAVQKGSGKVGASAAARRKSGASTAAGSSSPVSRQKATARKSTGSRPPASAMNRGRQSNGNNVPGEVQRAKRRYRPGAKALKDIRKYQKSTDLLLRKLPFARVVSALSFLVGSVLRLFLGQGNCLGYDDRHGGLQLRCRSSMAELCSFGSSRGHRSLSCSSFRRCVSIRMVLHVVYTL